MATDGHPLESVAGIQNALIHKHDPPYLDPASDEPGEPSAKRLRVEGPTCEVGTFSGDAIRYDPDVFHLLIGPQPFIRTATRQVLSQSPVLARSMSERWRNSDSHDIKLLDEDPEDIHLLIGFLESGMSKIPSIEHYIRYHRGGTDEFLLTAEKMADLFILGDRFEVQRLQTSVIDFLSESKLFLSSPRYFMRIAQKIFASQADTWKIYRTFFHKRFPILTSHITAAEMEIMKTELEAQGESLAANILLAEENRAQLLIANHTSTINKTTAKKDAYHLYSENLKKQNQELAEKWAMESAARAKAEVQAQRVGELELELAKTKRELAEAQGLEQFNLSRQLLGRLDRAQKSHVCEHAAFYDCGFEHGGLQSGKRKL